jgi:hypothetical protein
MLTVADGAAAPRVAGIITAMRRAEPPRSARRTDLRIPRNGSRSLPALFAALVVAVGVGLAAGCGSDGGSSEDVAAVEAGVVALGTTQNVSCKELGSETFGDVGSTVFMCSFEEEAEQTGEMRPANRCFVLSDDAARVTDVTADLRSRGSCPVISP